MEAHKYTIWNKLRRVGFSLRIEKTYLMHLLKQLFAQADRYYYEWRNLEHLKSPYHRSLVHSSSQPLLVQCGMGRGVQEVADSRKKRF